MAEEQIKKKVVDLMAVAREKEREAQPQVLNITANGQGNAFAIGANSTVIKTDKIVNKTEFTPGPEHITPAQAQAIQEAVKKLADKEKAGGLTSQKAFSKWYSAIKKRYNVPTYHAIPAELGDSVLAWLKQQSAIMRPKLRRNDNAQWRNEHYAAINARAKNLNLSKGDIYHIVLERLGKQVSSLTQLGERDLKKLYAIIMKM
ncbi:hypothetical protein [Desulfobotulus sp.]|uniref:hypothetical protein n=1 Tax=Desulfobotulus sp. TaxID=1940337 RepID=UPI002A370C2C|nr:hypothetical protein [Desulfobotulus sp.]MDY0164420.1 hypothetical protein [Desulfobotulus sp.]